MSRNKAEREQYVRECPEFNYMNTPDGTPEDMRYVFNHKVCLSLDEAYAYALESAEQLRNAEITAKVTGSIGAVSEKIGTDGTSLGRGDFTRPASGVIWP